MKFIAAILNVLINAAKNKWVWLRFLVLVIVGFAGAIFFSKTKVKQEDCTYYIEQNKQLIGALIDIKRDLEGATSVFFTDGASAIFAARLDTVPKPSVKKVITKIDSILWKIKSDSMLKKKQDSLKLKKSKA